jgi:hypothetical protein
VGFWSYWLFWVIAVSGSVASFLAIETEALSQVFVSFSVSKAVKIHRVWVVRAYRGMLLVGRAGSIQLK